MGYDKESNGLNGSHADSSSASSAGKPSLSSPPPALKEPVASPPQATRSGVNAAFHQFGQFIHVGRSPVPSQHGDGTMTLVKERPGFKQDLKHLKWKGSGKIWSRS